MPRPTITVPLSQPIIGHGGPIREVKLRPPSPSEYFRIGDPIVAVPAGEGRTAYMENDAALAAYLPVCLVEPNPDILDQADLADAMAIKEGIIGFFVQARLAHGSATSPSTSSST